MHYITDANVILAACTGLIVLMLQGLNLWRSMANGRQGSRNGDAIVALHESDKKLREHVNELDRMVGTIKRTLDERSARASPYGRRATDTPEMRSPVPAVAPVYDPRTQAQG